MKNTSVTASSKRVQQTRRKILQAASEEFSRHGYGGATTRMIAGRAGVNELTVFRHFESKKNLFLQVISNYSAIPDVQDTLQQHLSGDLRQDLMRIAGQMLSLLQARRGQILMTLHEANHEPEVHQAAANMLQRQKGMLAQYIAGQMHKGKLRPCDENLAAGAFLGMLFSHAIERPLLENESAMADETATAAFVDYFLNGLLPEKGGE